ncbi:hypothetical protein C2E31_09735 [Rhodopirellula baltica]|nr:hypothetical protein C2E31_09735 [Rhodopirellula baltica]
MPAFDRILVVALACSLGPSSPAETPVDAKDARVVKTGMQFDEARRLLESAEATKTEYRGARGFVPHKPSDPLPPRVHLYMLDEKVRLEMFVDRNSNAIQTMVIRFEPEVPARLKANYLEALCLSLIFHDDNSYSLRLKRSIEDHEAIESAKRTGK